MSRIENSTSLTAVIAAGGRLVDVDTSGSTVVMFFRSQDGRTEYRVEMYPDEQYDHEYTLDTHYRVEWMVQEFPVVADA